MKALRVVLCLSFLLGSAILSRAQLSDDASANLSAVAMLLPQHHHSDVSGPAYDLDPIEEMALATNPEIRVAVRKLAVVEAHVPSAWSLEDPSFMYRGWQVPLRQPEHYNAAHHFITISLPLS